MKKMGEETRGGRGRRHFWGCGDADGGVLRSAVRQSAGFGGAAGNAAGPGAGSAGAHLRFGLAYSLSGGKIGLLILGLLCLAAGFSTD